MDSDNRQFYQTAIAEADAKECANTWTHDQPSVSRNCVAYTHGYSSLKIESLNQRGQKGMEESMTCKILDITVSRSNSQHLPSCYLCHNILRYQR